MCEKRIHTDWYEVVEDIFFVLLFGWWLIPIYALAYFFQDWADEAEDVCKEKTGKP